MTANGASLIQPRGRPREFDIDEAVKSAMDVFWSNGYGGTSLPDLLEATQLSRSSLYAAFGDKHGLFLRALDQYIEDSIVRLDVDLDPSRPALDGVLVCLNRYVDRACGSSGKRGCLVIATATELAGKDQEVGRRIQALFQKIEQRLAAALTRARLEKEVADNVDPAQAARIILGAMEGIRVVGKSGIDRKAWLTSIHSLVDLFKA